MMINTNIQLLRTHLTFELLNNWTVPLLYRPLQAIFNVYNRISCEQLIVVYVGGGGKGRRDTTDCCEVKRHTTLQAARSTSHSVRVRLSICRRSLSPSGMTLGNSRSRCKILFQVLTICSGNFGDTDSTNSNLTIIIVYWINKLLSLLLFSNFGSRYVLYYFCLNWFERVFIVWWSFSYINMILRRHHIPSYSI